jgi:hypothetical protein
MKRRWHEGACRVLRWGLLTSLGLGAVGISPGEVVEGATTKKGEPFRYDARGRRDPFVALVRDGRILTPTGSLRPTSSTHPVLNGILWDPGGQSVALINDTEARVGDTVSGYRVAEIRRDAVVLTNGGEPLVLEISFETPPAGLSAGTTTGGEAR